MQFPNLFKKEKPEDAGKSMVRVEPQMAQPSSAQAGTQDGPVSAPWEVREDESPAPAFDVVRDERSASEKPVPETTPQQAFRDFEPTVRSSDELSVSPVRGPSLTATEPAVQLVLGDTGSAPAPEAPRREEAESKDGEAKDSAVAKKGLSFAFLKKRAKASEPVEEIDEETLIRRQKTRYRLVGAAALMLGAIVISPFLLDNEKNAAPPVSTEIPAMPDKATMSLDGKGALKGDAGSTSEVNVRRNTAPIESSTASANFANEARQPVKTPDGKPAIKSEAKSEAKANANPKSDSKAGVNTDPKAEPKKSDAKKPAAAPVGKGHYVQVVATSSQRNADKIVKELTAKGYAVYTVPVEQKAGTLWRVRVGPFKTRDEARNTQGRLALENYDKLILGSD